MKLASAETLIKDLNAAGCCPCYQHYMLVVALQTTEHMSWFVQPLLISSQQCPCKTAAGHSQTTEHLSCCVQPLLISSHQSSCKKAAGQSPIFERLLCCVQPLLISSQQHPCKQAADHPQLAEVTEATACSFENTTRTSC